MEVPHDFCRISEIKGFKVVSYEYTEPIGKEKFCPNCRQWLDINDFYIDNYRPTVAGESDNHKAYCKKCDNAKRKERRTRGDQSVPTKAEKETA